MFVPPAVRAARTGSLVVALSLSLYHAAASAASEQLCFLETGIPVLEGESPVRMAYVEEGAESARFTLRWRNAESGMDLIVSQPGGAAAACELEPGQPAQVSCLVPRPAGGWWRMDAVARKVAGPREHLSFRTAVINRVVTVSAGLARSVIQPSQRFLISAHPSVGRSVAGCEAEARVGKPNGAEAAVRLNDEGLPPDQASGDGLYQGEFGESDSLEGEYVFTVVVRCNKETARVRSGGPPGIGGFPAAIGVPTFVRYIRVTGKVESK